MENINGAMIYDDGITREEERREGDEPFLWPMEQRCEGASRIMAYLWYEIGEGQINR